MYFVVVCTGKVRKAIKLVKLTPNMYVKSEKDGEFQFKAKVRCGKFRKYLKEDLNRSSMSWILKAA